MNLELGTIEIHLCAHDAVTNLFLCLNPSNHHIFENWVTPTNLLPCKKYTVIKILYWKNLLSFWLFEEQFESPLEFIQIYVSKQIL